MKSRYSQSISTMVSTRRWTISESRVMRIRSIHSSLNTRSLGCLLLLFLVLWIPINVCAIEDADLLHAFCKHINEVYIPENYDEKFHILGDNPIYSQLALPSSITGYALGQQLQYIEKGTPEHQLWRRLERLLFNKMGESQRLKGHFRAGFLGLYDDKLSKFTGVSPKNAPDFFATLSQSQSTDQSGDDQAPPISRLLRKWTIKTLNAPYSLEIKIELTDIREGNAYQIHVGRARDQSLYKWQLEGEEIVIFRQDGSVILRLEQSDPGVWEGREYNRDGTSYVNSRTGAIISRRMY